MVVVVVAPVEAVLPPVCSNEGAFGGVVEVGEEGVDGDPFSVPFEVVAVVVVAVVDCWSIDVCFVRRGGVGGDDDDARSPSTSDNKARSVWSLSSTWLFLFSVLSLLLLLLLLLVLPPPILPFALAFSSNIDICF